MKNKDLTQEYVHECFDYNSKTGDLIWLNRPRHHFTRDSTQKLINGRFSGRVAGFLSGQGYRSVSLSNTSFLASRVIHLYMTGALPNGEIDHINHDRDDNRWENLRVVSRKQNCRNVSIRKTNKYGATGVHFCDLARKWRAQIGFNNRRIALGTYDDFETALRARRDAEVRYGFHPNHGI